MTDLPPIRQQSHQSRKSLFLPGFFLLLISGCANTLLLEFPEPTANPTPSHEESPGESHEDYIAGESQLTEPKAYSRQMFREDVTDSELTQGDHEPPQASREQPQRDVPRSPIPNLTAPSLAGPVDVPELPLEEHHRETLKPWLFSTMDHRDTNVDRAPQKYRRNRLPAEERLPQPQRTLPQEPIADHTRVTKPVREPEPQPETIVSRRSVETPSVDTGLKTDWELVTPQSPAPTPVESLNLASAGSVENFWQHRFQSSLRNPIEVASCGNGDARVLILGSLHGDERLSPKLVKDFAEHTARLQPDAEFTLVKSPNPDGLKANTRENSRQVDLNQNFPMRVRLHPASAATGEFPGSEVETQVLMRLLYDVNPQRVIQLKLTPTNDVWVVHNRKATLAAKSASTIQQIRLHEFQPDQLPGSLESYVTTMMDREMITLAIPESWTTDALQREVLRLLETLSLAELKTPHAPAETEGDDWGLPGERTREMFNSDDSQPPIVNRTQTFPR